ncbi:hypothetical protein N7499_000593 [Penicillium canescens]|uniref:Up-regulated during septation protein 1 domain-containing protein n=1 Tax=Penicillium canescens TaxID=5083 RepID=A0AAD6IIB1_PENCN|nr:uncharacterized protein N7446_011208 [Penicillium canescens]KAJ6004524.1 hypothetical protein N7522_006169 [Penicillium canescens]KAJ6047876.1 hypothetical protein N7460_004023 [Penicillium canescens]KAJ6048525.1 hypothetical protein N7446_011208 [Penicillium canescens]KAJ6100963.1 hypothetical protein N7499_000593 [Penicillium canescens]KAJ6173419.1 hypothetical protein N7485_006231 [Penicillium canescens]
MNSIRDSQSSYGDPRYLSTMTASDAPAPLHGRSLVDGYRDALDPQHDDRSRYNPLNPSHPRSSVLLNANDPVTMYLLTETAIGDSLNYEVLSFDEVEELKKEKTVLSSRIEGTKRKLALETKLRDAAQSLGRLYSPPSPRSSGEYGANGNTHRRSRSIFGRSGASEALNKSDSELAVSQRKCEELAQELWKLETRSQKINQRLLEHTAGVLQMTHKGLKKGPKNPALGGSESIYDGHEFDDRSLYRTTEHLDSFGVHGRIETNATAAMNTEAMQATERRLEELSERIHDMMIQSNPGEFIDPPPQPSTSGGPVNPTATVNAHLAYIQNGMNNIVLHTGSDAPAPAAVSEVTPEAESAWKTKLTEINNRVQNIVDRFGLTRSPTLPPPPDATHGDGLEEQLSYLQTGVDGLESRVDGLLEQKSILTTQIQQQRELNSKSDAERDAHIGDLTEQLTHVRRDLEVSERENNANREELALVTEQLDAMRHSGSSQEEAKAALVQTEGEVARLQSVVNSLHLESDARINEVSEARDAQDHAEAEVKRLQNVIESLERDTEARALEVSDARDRAEGEVQRLNVLVQTLQNDTGAKSKEISDARDRAEGEVERLEIVIQTIQQEHAAQTEEMKDSLYRAESEVKRLEDIIDSLQNDNAVQHEEIRNARDHAESEVTRLQVVIESMKHDSAAQTEEVRDARDRAESEVKRLQDIIDSLQNDTTTRGGEALEARERAEQEVAQLEAAIQQIRNQSDARVKEADDQRAQSDANAARLQNEMTELEGEIVRVTTELTMVKAELDGAYGTRAERAAEVAANPSVQKENDALVTRNIELTEELALLKSQRGGGDLQQRADTLERELRETIDDYEAMTKASIEFEKERERFESFIDSLRDRCEQLETQLAEERISWMNLSSPTSIGRDGASETTSTMVLKNEFKKMMRDTRNENMKILRAEQEERRRIEGLLRALRKEHAQVTGKMPSSGGTPL